MTFIGSYLHYIKSTYNVLGNKIMVHRDSVVNASIILELVNVKTNESNHLKSILNKINLRFRACTFVVKIKC